MDLQNRILGLLFHPVDTFRLVYEEEWTESLKYYLVLLVIFTILDGLIAGFFIYAMGLVAGITEFIPVPLLFALIFIGIFVVNLICLFLMGGFMHIFVLLFGGNRGYFETCKVLAYSSTPSLLLGWIPVIGVVGWVWTFVLNVTGIQELQNLSTPRALATVILPICILFIVFLIIYFLFIFLILMGTMACGMDPTAFGADSMVLGLD